jgi:hypothetical protein
MGGFRRLQDRRFAGRWHPLAAPDVPRARAKPTRARLCGGAGSTRASPVARIVVRAARAPVLLHGSWCVQHARQSCCTDGGACSTRASPAARMAVQAARAPVPLHALGAEPCTAGPAAKRGGPSARRAVDEPPSCLLSSAGHGCGGRDAESLGDPPDLPRRTGPSPHARVAKRGRCCAALAAYRRRRPAVEVAGRLGDAARGAGTSHWSVPQALWYVPRPCCENLLEPRRSHHPRALGAPRSAWCWPPR